MLVACRLAGLSALETYYAGIRAGAQFGPSRWHIAIKAAERPFRGRRVGWTQPRGGKTRGPPNGGHHQEAAARRVSQARRSWLPPPPPVRALEPSEEPLFRRRSARRQHDARSGRRGAAIAITAAAYFHANLLYDAQGRASMAGTEPGGRIMSKRPSSTACAPCAVRARAESQRRRRETPKVRRKE